MTLRCLAVKPWEVERAIQPRIILRNNYRLSSYASFVAVLYLRYYVVLVDGVSGSLRQWWLLDLCHRCVCDLALATNCIDLEQNGISLIWSIIIKFCITIIDMVAFSVGCDDIARFLHQQCFTKDWPCSSAAIKEYRKLYAYQAKTTEERSVAVTN